MPIVAATTDETVIPIIDKIPLKQGNLVTAITLEMIKDNGLIAKKYFSQATRVTDGFHVQKLTTEAFERIRIKYRCQAID